MKKKLISVALLSLVLLSLSMPIYARPGAGCGDDPVEGPQPWSIEVFAME